LQSITGLLNVQEQRLIEDAIRVVLCDLREEELRGDRSSVRRLHFDVDMFRAAGIESGHNGRQLIAAIRIGKLVTAQGVAVVVVIAVCVCLPEIEQGVRDRLAIGCVHVTGDDDLGARHALLE
jgi:hypothetical protein